MKILAFLGFILIADGGSNANEPLRVSIIELVANPERFEGKAVVAIGYIAVRGDEDRALFLHCEDLRNWNAANSVRIEVTDELAAKLKRGQLVYVSGTFSLRPGMRWTRWPSGQITTVRAIDPVPTAREPRCSAP